MIMCKSGASGVYSLLLVQTLTGGFMPSVSLDLVAVLACIQHRRNCITRVHMQDGDDF